VKKILSHEEELVFEKILSHEEELVFEKILSVESILSQFFLQF
jgi:hypothetical protein